jgi:hypothetical protein
MCTLLLRGLSILDWVGILIKEEGFFAKHPEPRLNATCPLFWHGTRACEQTGAGFNQPDVRNFKLPLK